jgi:hypothetical protein
MAKFHMDTDRAGAVQRGVGVSRDLERRNREGFGRILRLLFLGELDDVHVGLHFELRHGRNRHTGGEGDYVKKTVLQLPPRSDQPPLRRSKSTPRVSIMRGK